MNIDQSEMFYISMDLSRHLYKLMENFFQISICCQILAKNKKYLTE